MKNLCIAALSVCALAATTLAPRAGAQATPCKGTVMIDSIYQNSTGNGKFEYFVQIRNAKSTTTTTNLEFGEFAKTVTLFSRTLPNVTLKPYESQKVRFGTGTDGQINRSTVKIYYDDRMSLPKPYVLATRCVSTATK